MQTFNAINAESRFIKQLLKNTYLPILPTVNDGDIVLSGVDYMYKGTIIHCTLTGRLKINSYGTYNCSEEMICGPDFICGYGMRVAEYKIIEKINNGLFHPGFTSNYISPSNTYDIETHKHLGKYLRWYRDTYNINLMPLYNCFTGEDTQLVHIDDNTIKDGYNNKYKVWIVPISLNKPYNIYIDSATPVKLKGVFLNSVGRITKKVNGANVTLDSTLSNDFITLNNSQYTRPIKYTTATTDASVYAFNNNFYLMIQVNASHSGAIAVVEGEVAAYNSKYITNREIFYNKEDSSKSLVYSSFNIPTIPSLSVQFTGNSRPYSDKLIEFLLDYAITSEDETPNNVKRIQNELKAFGYDEVMDVWDDTLKFIVHNNYFSYTNRRYISNSHPTNADLEMIKKDSGYTDKLVFDENNNLIGFKDLPTTLVPPRNKTDITGFIDKNIENNLYHYRRA